MQNPQNRKYLEGFCFQHFSFLKSFARISSLCLDGISGILEAGQLAYPTEGTPQGGTISPLLSNIYLHYVLDEWFTKEVQPRMRGQSFIIRFADDFLLGFTNEEDAMRVMEVLPKRMAKYGLSLHPEKTKLY
ncbi:MAG: reverse transcriptase domain-containing protein [Cyclobacteriaceae bacterium]